MFDVQVEGNLRAYSAVAEITILPFSRVIHLQPVRVYERLVDGVWVFTGRDLMQPITLDDSIKANPETMAIDQENGSPAYSLLDERFKPLIEAFAKAAPVDTSANETTIPDHQELPS